MDIEANIQRFLQGEGRHRGVQPQERYASFDYCYNYFQSFKEGGRITELASSAHIQQSCLQLGFYLASWGMLRGSTFLHRKSAKFYEPLICYIASAPLYVWNIDVDRYTEENLQNLMECEKQIVQSLREGGQASGILVTKIMLGVFGNVPAFDTQFTRGFGVKWTGKEALRRVQVFYEENRNIIDSYYLPTIDFLTGQKTQRLYPKAKIIDMAGFIEGQK